MAIRVLLLDDHEDIRRGVMRVLAEVPEVEIVGEVGTVAAAREAIATLHPDVAVLDAQLPDGTGLELCRDIRSSNPETACVILTSFDNVEAKVAAVVAGAAAYVTKTASLSELPDVVRTVAMGATTHERHLLKTVTKVLTKGPAESSKLGELTPGERRIAELMAAGHTNREIAKTLGVPEAAVRTHACTIAGKCASAEVVAEHAGKRRWWNPFTNPN